LIITVTTNPSIDRTIALNLLTLGGVNRGDLNAIDPGGKGVNVSRALAAFGAITHAVLICGDLGSQWFGKKLNALKIAHHVIRAEGITRSNITLQEANGTVTKINEPGFELTKDVLNELLQTLDGLDLKGSWVVLAGRLNPGADVNTYRDLAQFVRDRGAKVAIDGSGPEFRAALAVKPELIKPNQFELAELVGRPLKTIHDVIAAAREVIAGGVEQVLCSLGKDGAILVTSDEVMHCEPEHAATGTPVGAGDILLAIYLGGGATPSALKDAIAWSAASVPLPGTAIPTPAQAAAVSVKINEVPKDSRELAEVH
jgi:1-phosphofructokinase/6-phosphofructokinase 2